MEFVLIKRWWSQERIVVKLLLSDTKVYPWTKANDIAFRGYFITGGDLYKDSNAIKYIEARLKVTSFQDILSELNGAYSLIYSNATGVHAATDRVRSLPLFYSCHREDFYISDQATMLYKNLPTVTFDNVSVEDFQKNNLFVSGKHTLFQEINQLQAGEWLFWNSNTYELSQDDYFLHAEGKISSKNQQELAEEFKAVFSEACENLKLALDGRTAVVPLSGGVDSRELLLMLHTIRYDKVLCFTYGRKGNQECRIAQKLADYFGYPWIEVVYTRKLWRSLKDYQNGTFFNDYLTYAGNYAGLPHVQDLLAVKILKEQGAIPKDSVFMPGHTGTITGGNLNPVFLEERVLTRVDTIGALMSRYYKSNNRETLSDNLYTRIDSYFAENGYRTNSESEAQHHNFSMRERQAKFIINSVRVYEYLGYEWLLPLCDRGFLDFMKGLPLPFKHNKKFIRDFMGLKSIKSTSDETLYKRIARLVRGIAPLRMISRKLSRLLDYFLSTTQTGGLYGWAKYSKGVITGDEHFSGNVLASQRYLSLIKEKKNETN
jgi:asparagine synthase (glutamine-hydrolysing)